jgi:AcrR family transcriptional regulator
MKKDSVRRSHLSPTSIAPWEPRKSPVQARSAASVEALLGATIQFLLRVGKERLTTTRVASRAGVSVGTLYQYFPNKRGLLQAVLKQHMEEVAAAVEGACLEQKGNTLAQMATALVGAFLDAKMRDIKTSVALYSVSSDVDGAKIVQRMSKRMHRALVAMLSTSRESLQTDPRIASSMLQGAMAGVSRRLLESEAPEDELDSLRQELVFLVRTYLEACAARSAHSGLGAAPAT